VLVQEKVTARIKNWAYFSKETIRLILVPGKKRKILFSIKPVWEKSIRSGFMFTRHKIEFNEFTPENIKNSDLVVPLTISDLELLNKDRSMVKDNAIPIPQLEAIWVCDDKFRFYMALKENGFEETLPKVGTNLPYPYILKGKWGEYGTNCYIITDAEKEKQYIDLINNKDFFCQEIVQGKKEYATHILFKDNKIQASLNVKYTWPGNVAIKGKDKFISRTIVKCPYLELFTAMLKSINFEGICCVNYKVSGDKPFIFEINPRFGGSLGPYFSSFIRHVH
jgi:predicted ATP-grasp superfamily ATP-dependent carboligase